MFFTNDKKNIQNLSIIIAVIVMSAVLAIALLLQDPSQRSEYFWTRLAWIEFLIGLCFLFTNNYFLSIIFGENVKEKGGAMPALGSIIYLYSFLSSILVIVTSFLPDNNLISRFHFILQILLIASFAIIYLLINLSLAAALSGSSIPKNVIPPSQLITKISMLEKRFKNNFSSNENVELIKTIKKLRESIQFSIPNSGKSLNSIEYQSFITKIDHLYEDAKSNSLNFDDANTLNDIIKKLNDLIIDIDTIKIIR